MPPMDALRRMTELGHEELVVVQEPESGLRAVVAIHDTALGPAVGGTRMRPYATLDEAVTDALRLSRAMSYKAALAEVARGGGKGVIVGDPARDKSRPLLTAYARLLDRLGGRFLTGADLGLDHRDVKVLRRHTKHVSHTAPDAPVDTAELAALGVFEAIVAAAEVLRRDVAGLHVAVQGVGQVGLRLARMLRAEGARLTVCDAEASRAERAASELGAEVVAPEAVYDLEADVFSPNAAGGVVNAETVPRLRCRAVVGGANEQLAAEEDGDALHARGILFGPDYVVNAGGLISLLFEQGEIDADAVRERVRLIGDRVAEIWHRAGREGLPPHRLADHLAEERLGAARAAKRVRREPGDEGQARRG